MTSPLSTPGASAVPVAAAYKRDALAATRVHLDVEMETGTGKTYCYIKSIFEMNQRYGWSKFVIMVPSIAIREGVYKSLQITADHFTESYGKKARFFIYNSKRLHELESFSSDAGINVMVINIQAFNARGADNRRIYEELDDFQSRKPIDVIASNRPILILDEPQKWKARRPWRRCRSSSRSSSCATRRPTAPSTIGFTVLDALDAYNQKLVKKIAVRGIQTRGLAGTNAYLYLEGIDISKKAPVARIEIEVKLKSGEIKRQLRRLEFRDDLFVESGGLDQYRGFTISQIDAVDDTIEFTNGIVLQAGEANGDVSERDIRRIQIRETIKAHLDKEKQLFAQGIKVLSLFFIDEVVKYRDYDQADTNGEYARVFEEEYELLKAEYLSELAVDNEAYRKYLAGIDPTKTHNGYFSIDKKTNRLKDPAVGARSVDSDDVDAYDLILKDKERLLSIARTHPVHLLSLGASRGVGQPERLCHVHAEAQRQHHFPSPGSGAWPAAERRPAWRPDGPSGGGARHQRADGGGERELQGLRCRSAKGDRGDPLFAATAGDRGLFHGQDDHYRAWPGRGNRCDGQADLPLFGEERLHRRCRSGPQTPTTKPKRPGHWPTCPKS